MVSQTSQENRRRPLTEADRKLRKIERVIVEPLRARSSRLETIELTSEMCDSWKRPVWQREITRNSKVSEISREILETRVIPGTLTIGEFDGKQWRIDCQHRIHAFEASGIDSAYADVRFLTCDSQAEMAEEYNRLNSHAVKMRPDDYLRALELQYSNLALVRDRCPFIGYDKARRELTVSPILGMGSVLRYWFGSATDVPIGGTGQPRELAQQLTNVEADYLCEFLLLALEFWTRDPAYSVLWGRLNMVLTMWVFRRSVASLAFRSNEDRVPRQVFAECMRALRMDPGYLDWLHGRILNQRDRGPAYARLRKIMTRAITKTGVRVSLPTPAWA